jgi:DNA-binding transcriptional ArsR family regulator
LCAELDRYWRLTLAHHWPRIHAVLESDVIYRARQLVLEGPQVLFNDIHHPIHYADGRLSIETRHNLHLKPDGAGLLLIPLVFMWNDLLLPEAGASLAIAYGARGGGLWRQTIEEPGAALIAAVGAGRARVLQQLETPRNTGELAERLSMTPGNISIHIARLREAGLVESQQTGKWVFHRLTMRGEQLMALFGDRHS